jgi:hypothetical protein
VAGVAGINGVAWDAVELPSQLLENWAWQSESLMMFARHYETGELLPQTLLHKMLAAKHFQSAMFMVRQLEFGLFDLRLHMQHDPHQPQTVQEVLVTTVICGLMSWRLTCLSGLKQMAFLIPLLAKLIGNGYWVAVGRLVQCDYLSILWVESPM